MTRKKPGRPKGTRVTYCACGRRVAGMPNRFVVCPGCGKRVKIVLRKKKARSIFLKAHDTKPKG